MDAVRTVGIFAKPNAPRAAKLVPELLRWLEHRGVEARFDSDTARYAGMSSALSAYTEDSMISRCNCFIDQPCSTSDAAR